MSIPFYGGVNGQSFKIGKKFSNFAELKAEADMGWSSSTCMVGDYVIIDYFYTPEFSSVVPDVQVYESNRTIDASYGDYNGTIWQKIYFEAGTGDQQGTDVYVGKTASAENGIGYRILFCTDSPVLFTASSTTASASSQPSVAITRNYTQDQFDYNLVFTLPDAWDFAGNIVNWSNPETAPTVSIANAAIIEVLQQEPEDWNENYGNYYTQDANGTYNQVIAAVAPQFVAGSFYEVLSQEINPADAKQLKFTLPRAQDINHVNITFTKKADGSEGATGVVNKNSPYTPVNPSLDLDLPVNQYFKPTTLYDAGAFELTQLGPMERAGISTDYDVSDTIHQYPLVSLKLPRNVITNYGDALGSASNMTINEETDPEASGYKDWQAVKNLAVGDVYVNTTFAAVHRIASVTPPLPASPTRITTTYLGTMQLALPQFSDVEPLAPYYVEDSEIKQTIPIVSSHEDPTQGPYDAWHVDIQAPIMPLFTIAGSELIPSTQQGSIVQALQSDNTTINIAFKIPKGTRFYDEQYDGPIANLTTQVDGDFYLDHNGQIYRYLDGNNPQWVQAEYIRGEAGARFEIKNEKSLDINAGDIGGYTLLTSEPIDWSTNYTDYYTYDSVNNLYHKVPSAASAPTWAVDTYYEAASVDPFSYATIGAYIEANYRGQDAAHPDYRYPAPNEIINISYVPVGEENYTSYWMMKVGTHLDSNDKWIGGSWSGSKLTGDASNSIIIDAVSQGDETNKAYSVHVVNNLIDNINTSIGNINTAISGTGGINDQISDINTSISSINDTISGEDGLEDQIAALVARIAALEAIIEQGWGTLPISEE